MDTKIPKWIQDRQTDIKKEEKQWKDEHGDYFAFPEGETKIEINVQTPPQKKITQFGSVQWQYEAKVNEEQKIIGVPVMLDKQIIYALMQEMNPMVIIRVGTEKNTRYSVKGLK